MISSFGQCHRHHDHQFNKGAKVNSTAPQRKIRGESGAGISSEDVLSSGAEDRLNHIATAACFKAEARGLSPGQELEDWLEAETESNDW